MARWVPQKKDVLDALAAEILHNYGRGRAIVAIDGADPAITAVFADDLASSIRETGHHAARSSINGFLRSRSERHARGADSAAGRYEDSFDYSTFRRVLIEPFRMGQGASFVTSAYDAVRDSPVQTKWRTGPADAILIVDGEFLNRPQLAGGWNYSIWLDSKSNAAESDAARSDAVVSHAIGSDAERIYEAEAAPRTAATAIFDASDPDRPRRVFADSC